MILKEPEVPWYVNVVHLEYHGRAWCCSPVDYSVVEWSKDINEVNCAACHRAS